MPKWDIVKNNKTEKAITKLPISIKIIIFTLIKDLIEEGPIQYQWPRFGKLTGENAYHCHLKRGRPTYVACWRILDKKRKTIEVFYVGTHENAPY